MVVEDESGTFFLLLAFFLVEGDALPDFTAEESLCLDGGSSLFVVDASPFLDGEAGSLISSPDLEGDIHASSFVVDVFDTDGLLESFDSLLDVPAEVLLVVDSGKPPSKFHLFLSYFFFFFAAGGEDDGSTASIGFDPGLSRCLF